MSLLAFAGLEVGKALIGAGQQQDYYKRLSQNLLSEKRALEGLKSDQEILRQESLGVATEEFGMGSEMLGKRTDIDIGTLERGKDVAEGQTGLAFSGGIESKFKESKDAIMQDYQSSYDVAFAGYEKGKMGINVAADAAISTIEQQMKDLTKQIDYADSKGSNYFANIWG